MIVSSSLEGVPIGGEDPEEGPPSDRSQISHVQTIFESTVQSKYKGTRQICKR